MIISKHRGKERTESGEKRLYANFTALLAFANKGEVFAAALRRGQLLTSQTTPVPRRCLGPMKSGIGSRWSLILE